MPAKITSYFAAGRPLLVAANGEAARVSFESGAALVSPAGNAEQLAENIIKLYNMSSEKLVSMGEKGKQEYLNNYTRAKGLKDLETFIFQ